MKIKSAIDNILMKYGKMAEIDAHRLEDIFNDHLKRGLSASQIYNAVRLIFSANFN